MNRSKGDPSRFTERKAGRSLRTVWRQARGGLIALSLGLGMAGAMAQAMGAPAPKLALTMDDGPHLSATPSLSPQERNAALLKALADQKVQAALFVTCGNGADRPEGLALVQDWARAGHFIGNHTMTHLDLHNPAVTVEQYQGEIERCQQILHEVPTLKPWFRFTFLREGKPESKRDAMRAWMNEKGWLNATVSLDTSDWRLNEYLVARLKANPKAEVADIRQAYLDHLWQRAQAYRALAQRLQGRDIAQVLLVHHNLLNALWLNDAIAMFKARGWQFVSPAEAFADPVYALKPMGQVYGQSLLISMSKSLGLWKFEGWERLMDDGDFEIESLERQRAAGAPASLPASAPR